MNALLCPRCVGQGAALQPWFDGVYECAECSGMWVSRTLLVRAFGDLNWQAGEKEQWHRLLACPECTNNMARIRLRTFVIDECTTHGAWFDRHELHFALGVRTVDRDALYQRLTGRASTPRLSTPPDNTEEAIARRQRIEKENELNLARGELLRLEDRLREVRFQISRLNRELGLPDDE